MSIPGSALPLLLASPAGAAAGADNLSLRFSSGDSAYLNRGFSSGNQKTWTWSCWCKPCVFSGDQGLFGVTGGVVTFIRFKNAQLDFIVNGATHRRTSAVFRDPSAWYHFVWAVDTTQGTASNRSRFYVNGVEITTAWSIDSALTQDSNTGVSSNATHLIGSTDTVPNDLLNAYLADVHFIDGQALDPTDFGEFDATTGAWNPIEYTGSYGTNGFHLDFADNSSAAALGTDTSGNGNDWTVNNISVTAGSGNDSLRDSPTNGDTANDTGAGGEVSGNYCTWNPLRQRSSNTVSNGNLDVTLAAAAAASITGTFAQSTGKWYWEITHNGFSSTNSLLAGVIGANRSQSGISLYGTGSVGYYATNGRIYIDGADSAYGNSFTTGDIIGVALDLDSATKTITFYKNGSSQGAINLPSSDSVWSPAITNGTASSTQSAIANFGQRPFAYSAPSGFKALCTANLDDPTIADPSTVMDVVTYTGAGTTQVISGLGFSPDLVWIKNRSTAISHRLFDSVRGAFQELYSDLGSAEVDRTSIDAGVKTFDSDGFTLGSYNYNGVNLLNDSYVGWTWDAGTSNATNTSGSITSTVRANISAGFSVITWTGTKANASVGHGLGVTPEFIIFKTRGNAYNWRVYHVGVGNTAALGLNLTQAAGTNTSYFNNTSPTSSVINLGTSDETNDTSMVAYCWAPVENYSAFGSYTGNGSTDGPFVYTGFRPRWVVVKNADASGDWSILDTARDTYNRAEKYLLANSSGAEGSPGYFRDYLSNGFKIRDNGSGVNTNGQKYIYAAFAENPFKYARAR
jgi:hypothetical protein